MLTILTNGVRIAVMKVTRGHNEEVLIVFEFVKEMREVRFDKAVRGKMVRKCREVGFKFDDMVPRMFEAFECGDGVHYLSIQASAFHNCEPRETINKRKYRGFEVACCVRTGDGRAVFESAKEFLGGECDVVMELDECFDGAVFSRVPCELVQRLVDVSRKVYGGRNGS